MMNLNIITYAENMHLSVYTSVDLFA